jgi:lipoyl(octanoyl) transferase
MTITNSDSTLHIIQLGSIEYTHAMELQTQLAVDIATGKRPDTLLILEHPHTYTFGRRGDEENLIWGKRLLQEKGIAVHWTDRGGDVTYHGPGQLIGYPLLQLGAVQHDDRLPKADYVGYIRSLEKTVIRSLASLGIVSGQIADLTGVWVQPDVASRCPHCPPAARKLPSKIASIGVKVDVRGVSRHGLSINVCPDMSFWDGINACGITDYPAISVAQLLDPMPSMEETMYTFIQAFTHVFDYKHVMIFDTLPSLEIPSI